MTASPALAGRGHKWQFAAANPFTLPASLCGFKIRVTLPVNKVYIKALKASDGSMAILATGALKSTFTNLSTGKAITENVTGPGKAITHPDGSITIKSGGHNGLFLVPADQKRFGLPGVSVTVGGLRASFAANGRPTSITLHGHVAVNVCAALS